MKHLCYLMFAMLLFSCGSSKSKDVDSDTVEDRIGKYLYLGKDSEVPVIHISKRCVKSLSEKSPYGVVRVDTADVRHFADGFLCGHCVTDEIYEQLIEMSERQKKNKKRIL